MRRIVWMFIFASDLVDCSSGLSHNPITPGPIFRVQQLRREEGTEQFRAAIDEIVSTLFSVPSIFLLWSSRGSKVGLGGVRFNRSGRARYNMHNACILFRTQKERAQLYLLPT